MLATTVLFVFVFSTIVSAGTIGKNSERAIEKLTPAQIAQFIPFTRFASAAYCAPELTSLWTCGGNPLGSSLLPLVTHSNLIH
jgi:hypothetical protein